MKILDFCVQKLFVRKYGFLGTNDRISHISTKLKVYVMIKERKLC